MNLSLDLFQIKFLWKAVSLLLRRKQGVFLEFTSHVEEEEDTEDNETQDECCHEFTVWTAHLPEIFQVETKYINSIIIIISIWFMNCLFWLELFYFNFLETIPYNNEHILIDAVYERQNFELFWEEMLEVFFGHASGTDIRSCDGDKCEDPWLRLIRNSDVVRHLNCYASGL